MPVYVKRSQLSHADGRKHKYIARIRQPNGRYRYFYDKEEYLSYLNKGKNDDDSVFDKFKNAAKDVAKKLSPSKRGESPAKKFLSKFSDKSSDALKFLMPRKVIKNAMDWISRTISSGENEGNGKISSKEKPNHKYIARVKTANGKYRYFYDQDEYDAYLQRQKYQKNEPGFMKNVPDIDPDKIFTKDENMDKINEKFDPSDPSASTNCGNCSAAYELRMRGYDVEAKAADGEYNGRIDRVYDYFENPEKLYVNSDGSTTKASEDFERKAADNDLSVWDTKVRHRDSYEFYAEKKNYSASSIEKAIKSNNPPGSRGFIDVNWKEGGGHSIVYEVDKSGKVTIRDSQTYDTYDVSELSSRVSNVTITRTDNLKLKSGVKNTVNVNEDNKREYYADEGSLHKAD